MAGAFDAFAATRKPDAEPEGARSDAAARPGTIRAQEDEMLQSYVPILILIAISIVNAVGMVVASHFLGPLRPTSSKSAPYESGILPLGSARERFSVKFYLVAILFIVFDIETVFLIPWGVAFRGLGLFGFVEMLIFIGVLLVGLAYVWKKGALEWD